MDAIIICVGDEILSGDVTDLNSTWLAKRLAELGTIVKRIEVIPDDVAAISSTVKSSRADKVLITGGLGPTHDDVTRQAIAVAFGRKLARNDEAVKVVEAAAARRHASPRPQSYVMAEIPEGAAVISNPVGAAPGFIIDGRVYVFPGVPAEMKSMFELVKDDFNGKKLFVDWLVTRRPESDIVSELNEAVRMFPEVSFGSYPSDVVKVKMKSYDPERLRAAKEWLAGRIL
ncbi:molybdenum cofactor synthesis domain protein (CinA-like) [Methanocella conradii HZ254]|uniref:Molybdenum cofactor synthesis domain protein (CinA-like) n=1 Tax=Methanocella conradii (strain DSM 24694 / JCM 17849 / CGMCC 1.5162 / HZ254) TaxID=1041930 RepID=H8I646_METCZ|nr:molybdopterin-binding protein [Methanocella conradii]AFD00693.1 molybdenum cofactor synthesis domain protein (CinA-like) [Methanocella conradii HZ254]